MARLIGKAKLFQIARELIEQVESDGHDLSGKFSSVKKYIGVNQFEGERYNISIDGNTFKGDEYSPVIEGLIAEIESNGYDLAYHNDNGLGILTKSFDIWVWNEGGMTIENILNHVEIDEEAVENAI
jgi:hypothetical protein